MMDITIKSMLKEITRPIEPTISDKMNNVIDPILYIDIKAIINSISLFF